MKVHKIEKLQFDENFKSIFAVEFPRDLLPDADLYDFALVAIGQRKKLVSFVTIQKVSELTAYICYGAVIPHLRTKGFGRKSLEAFTDYLFDNGFSEVKFSTQTDNTAMRAAGISVGFRPMGKRENKGRSFREFIKEKR